jgi:serine/threonine-protein kinase CTR1
MTIIVGIVLGMRYLHARGIIHRNLAASNVLIGDLFSAKICGFGSAEFDDPGAEPWGYAGTLPYVAPEVFGDDCGPSADVFSFGVLLWEIVRCENAITELRGKHTANSLGIYRAIDNGWRPRTDGIPDRPRGLMEACWAENPAKRPTFARILDHLARMNYELFPGVQGDDIKGYVTLILKKEAQHPPVRLEPPDLI